MGKFRFRAYLGRPLFAVLIVAGAFVSGIFEVRGGVDVLTVRSKHATTVAATVQAPRAPAAAASGTLARVSL